MRQALIWSVLSYLRFWAQMALTAHRPYVIGIAGSVGKSSTRNLLHSVLKNKFPTKVVSGNSETGVPLGILGIEMKGYGKKDWLKALSLAPFKIFNQSGTKYLIVEMGIDDPFPPKNMSYLLTIVKPDMAIDLNATATHTEQFEKVLKKTAKNSTDYLIERIAEEDSKIITNGYTKIGIYNGDDKNLAKFVSNHTGSLQLLTFGTDKGNTVSYEGYEADIRKTKFSFRVPSKRGERMIEISLKNVLLPINSREGLASVILATHALGLKYDEITQAVEDNFSPPKGRSTIFEGIRDSIIIDSSYNSSKSTVISFLDMVFALKKRTKRPIVFVMGDMRELGNEAKSEHEDVARYLLPYVDELHCVGSLTSEFVIPYVKNASIRKPKKVEWYKNAVQAGLHLKDELPRGAIVLVKGSQNTIFLEETIKFILNNQSDVKMLTRQEDYWLKAKSSYFKVDRT